MMEQMDYGNAPEKAAAGGGYARSWWWIFLLLTLWVYGMRTGVTFLTLSDGYVSAGRIERSFAQLERSIQQHGSFDHPEVQALLDAVTQTDSVAPEDLERMGEITTLASTLMYPVQILGVALFPLLLAKLGVLNDDKKEKRVTIALLAVSFALMPVFVFVRGLTLRAVPFYALLSAVFLCPSVAMGIALRKAALHWREEKAALCVGIPYLLDLVFGRMHFYSWEATKDGFFHLGFSFALYGGLLAAAAIVRLRLRDGAVPALPPARHVYPPRFPRNVLALMAAHALFSAAINTVIYFENMDDFHTPVYETFFYVYAALVILSAIWLYHRRRWLAPVVIGLLLVCFGQGLTLFGISSIPLAIAYNLITVTGKMPPFMLALIVPVYYAIGTRKPNLACLGFAVTTAADFLLQLTQFTKTGISGVLPGNARQGLLLLVGLCLVGALFYLYTRFERTRTDALLAAIREGRRERKTTRDTVDGLDLTSREKEVTTLLLAGDSQKMIAAKLQVSLSTVYFHIRNLYRKLNIQSKAELFSLFLPVEPQDAA